MKAWAVCRCNLSLLLLRALLRRTAVPTLIVAVATVAGCATSGPGPNGVDDDAAAATKAPAQTVPYIMVSPSSVGTWYDLGEHLAPWLSGDAPVAAAIDTVPTRVAGLHRSDGRWLALVLLQQSRGAGAVCPPANSLHVASARADDCIRLRRDADYDGWLQQQHPVLNSWVERHGWSTQPRAWISSRVPEANSALEVHVLVDPALIEGATRTNTDFLEAGRPGLTWARQLGAATHAAANGSALQLPQFPFAAQVVRELPSTEPLPTQAEQVMPERGEPPTVRPPRQDRQ